MIFILSFYGLVGDPIPLNKQAKPETVAQVCEIVRKQLSVVEGTEINGETKFTALGADSLDTVEIVMHLEETFDISVEESSAQSIETVQDAADLIEDLVAAKATLKDEAA